MTTSVSALVNGASARPASSRLVTASAPQPKTWQFINCETDQPVTVTCMLGCTEDHSSDMYTPTHPADVTCHTGNRGVVLPITDTATPDIRTVLGFQMNVMPFADTMAEQLPHVTIEVIEEHWLSNLGPDELDTVINKLQARVDAMRVAHAQLIEVRAEYRNRA